MTAEHQPRIVPAYVQLFEHFDSNMSGDAWTWTASLRRLSRGRFSVGLWQTVTSHRALRVPALSGFRRGRAMFDFLNAGLHEHANLSFREVDWESIAAKCSMLDSRLSKEVLIAFRAEEAEDCEPQPLPSQADLHATRATWPQLEWRGAGGFHSAFQNGIRARAARFYATRHLERHGVLPEGVHRVEVTIGSRSSGADIEPPMGSTPTRLVVDITYPSIGINPPISPH